MKKTALHAIMMFTASCLTGCFLLLNCNEVLAQTNAVVEGEIFSKTSTAGYNVLITNTDETQFGDLTMYNNSSSFSILHYGTNHATEATNSTLNFSKDLLFKGQNGAIQRFRIQSDGNLVIGAKTPSTARAVLNPFRDHYIGNVKTIFFNDPFPQLGGRFTLATTDSLVDGSGIHGNGAALTLWSSGDPVDDFDNSINAQLFVLDEDRMDDNDANPYNDGAVVAYLTQAGLWTASDQNKKDHIEKLDKGAIQKLRALNAYSYHYKRNDREFKKQQEPDIAVGLMAQELELVIPEAVNKTRDGEYFVNYSMVTPVLVEAIKEQAQIIDQFIAEKNDLQKVNLQLKTRLDKLEIAFEKMIQSKE